VSLVEQAMVNSGITLLKYWLEVGPEEQTKVSKTALPTAASSGTFRKWT
jgi:polyphosphate kinase 2 (PPK2 family)